MYKYIEVHIVEAKDVKDTDTIGKGDPYIQFWFDNSATKYRTDARAGTATPVWDKKFKIKYENQKVLNLQLLDDDVGRDDIIGDATLDLSEFERADDKRYVDKWCTVQTKGDAKSNGEVRVILELID
nr:14628_t:CDS:2 [Entrophospora candida]CAG8579848.1 14045_t:CDS:2 [Entrophospora candida]